MNPVTLGQGPPHDKGAGVHIRQMRRKRREEKRKITVKRKRRRRRRDGWENRTSVAEASKQYMYVIDWQWGTYSIQYQVITRQTYTLCENPVDACVKSEDSLAPTSTTQPWRNVDVDYSVMCPSIPPTLVGSIRKDFKILNPYKFYFLCSKDIFYIILFIPFTTQSHVLAKNLLPCRL